MKRIIVLLFPAIFLFNACKLSTTSNNKEESLPIKKDTISCAPGSKLNVQKIEEITGMKGVEKNGEYKITVPQHDLKIVVDGFKIIPAMGLGSWTAFTPCGDSAMVMGDIIV